MAVSAAHTSPETKRRSATISKRLARLVVTGDGDPHAVGLWLQKVGIVTRRGLPNAERLGPSLTAGGDVFRRYA